MAAKTKTKEEPTAEVAVSKQERLDRLIRDTNAKWVKKGVTTPDRPIVGTIATMMKLRGEKVPTGSPILDFKLGGGLTRGTSVLMWGPAGSGKSSLAMTAAAAAIRQGGYVLWIQTDPGDTGAMAEIQGISPDDPHFIHQDVYGSGEMTFEILQSFLTSDGIPTDLIDLVVVDSIAGLSPREELAAIRKDGLDDASQGMSLPERMMSRLFRIMHSTKMYDHAAVIFISEARVDLGSYNTPEKAKGGRATMHGVRLNLRLTPMNASADQVKKGDRIVGHKYRTKFVKDGIRHRHQSYEFETVVRYGVGIDKTFALKELLLNETDAFTRSGSHLRPTPALAAKLPPVEYKINSEAAFEELLNKDAEFRAGCEEYLKEYSTKVADPVPVEEPAAESEEGVVEIGDE